MRKSDFSTGKFEELKDANQVPERLENSSIRVLCQLSFLMAYWKLKRF